jgi:hypothetical protein
MMTGTLADCEPEGQAGELRPASWRRRAMTWLLWVLIPLSLCFALAVLVQMSSSAAAATGGCGGG